MIVMKILIIDDFEMTRQMIKTNLMSLGFMDFDDAENGQVAYEKLKAARDNGTPFTLIFCDWNMPVMSGIELLYLCRTTPGLTLTTFIMVTAEAEIENVTKTLKMGANDYIIKPISLEILKKKMDAILKKIIAKQADK